VFPPPVPVPVPVVVGLAVPVVVEVGLVVPVEVEVVVDEQARPKREAAIAPTRARQEEGMVGHRTANGIA
jgi:hypothetical protein